MRVGVGGFLALLMAFAACGPGTVYDPEVYFEEHSPGVVGQGLLVSEVGGCATVVVSGLSSQLVDAVNCARPATLEDFSQPSILVGTSVWPFLQGPARSGLQDAVASHGGTIQINSAYRTLAQQYLLYHWYQQGLCGIALAARPSHSNHESGLAVDVQDHAAWQASLEGNGWLWFGSSDAVHFDFAGGGTVDLSSLSVTAFQQLWNLNNPQDPISEDGLYGPQTESRLQLSPADGFPLALCAPQPADAGIPDAGQPDAAARPDAAVPDAAPIDASTPDASALVEVDAGAPDAGHAAGPDAGSSMRPEPLAPVSYEKQRWPPVCGCTTQGQDAPAAGVMLLVAVLLAGRPQRRPIIDG